MNADEFFGYLMFAAWFIPAFVVAMLAIDKPRLAIVAMLILHYVMWFAVVVSPEINQRGERSELPEKEKGTS
jgi:hypothetical protein